MASRLTITANDRANVLRMWLASAELRAKASDLEGQISEVLGLDDASKVNAELEAGATIVADFDKALAADDVAAVG